MKTDMNKKQKNTRTFLIKIMDQQNGTWQGSVTWVEEQREQHFRSALELLKLIDGALDNNYEVRIEEQKEDAMKSNTKKRLIAFMLCMVLVLSSATSAFADEQQDMDSTNQIETTAEAETETQEAVADEPMVTSLDASSEEQQPVADEPAVTAEEPAAENKPICQKEKNQKKSQNSSKENKAEDEISIQTTINGTTITMSGPRSSFPEGNNYEISASELNEEKTKDVEIALKKKEDETNTKIATYKAYDIKLLVDGIETQPTGDVNVKFEGGEVKEMQKYIMLMNPIRLQMIFPELLLKIPLQ